MDSTHSHTLLADIDPSQYPFADALAPIVLGPVGVSSAGYPYLEASLFRHLRDSLPLLFRGGRTRDTADRIGEESEKKLPREQSENIQAAVTVVRTILNTAAITAPPDLWLLRQVLETWKDLELIEPLLSQDGIDPSDCGFLESEVRVDLTFLLSRGYLVERDGRYFAGPDKNAGETFHALLNENKSLLRRLLHNGPISLTALSEVHNIEQLTSFLQVPNLTVSRRESWCANWNEINLGHRWVPVLLGLSQSPLLKQFTEADCVGETVRSWKQLPLGENLVHLLTETGVLTQANDDHRPTSIGQRVFKRGAGPFGIIQAYQPYMENLSRILSAGRQEVHVQRGPNVAASQLANRTSFEKANNSLDRFSQDTGFTYQVYIEHALGRGEATRQRFERMGPALTYIGADLEQASIDSAMQEQSNGHLPKNMKFLSKRTSANHRYFWIT